MFCRTRLLFALALCPKKRRSWGQDHCCQVAENSEKYVTQKGCKKSLLEYNFLFPYTATNFGRKGAGKHFLTVFSFFQVNFFIREFGLIIKYFLSKHLKKY